MKLVPVAPKSTELLWKTDTASVGMYLFGGTAATSLNASPLDTTSAAEFVRLQKSCDLSPKGAVCDLEGPAKFEITTRRLEASVDMAPGERARVEVRNTVVTCRDHPR